MQNAQSLRGKFTAAFLMEVQSLHLFWAMSQKYNLSHQQHLMLIGSTKILSWTEPSGKYLDFDLSLFIDFPFQICLC